MPFTPSFILLDAARMFENIDKAFELNKSGQSLYKEKGEKILTPVAPYLFNYNNQPEFATWLSENGWGNSWGIFINTIASFEQLHHHFRRFLMVKTEEGKQLYFRFYDPRVLRIFLPTCDTKQLQELFGPVEQFICEDEDAAFALLFSFHNNKLITEKIAADTIFPAVKKVSPAAIILPAQYNDEAGQKNNPTQQQKKTPRRFFVD
jgi:Domain of unknown function (DUF4123)